MEERDASLESLKAEAAEKEEQIGDLTAEAAEKTEQIEAMNAEAAEKDAQIEALAAQAAEKDAQIADLSSRLEQAEASLPKEDDLSWIKEGRYINTKRFLAFLEDNEIWYDVKTSDSDENSDQIFFYDLTFTSQSGVDFPVDCTVYMSSNNDRISVVIYDLIAFDANNIGQVKDVLADLNAYCLWVKFYVEDDDTVTAAIDCPVTDSPEMVDVFVASLGHTFDVIEEVYDYLAPYNIQ